MKKYLLLLLMLMSVLFSGCSLEEAKEPKIRDLDFTVVEEGTQPESLEEIIEEKKEEPFQLSYLCGEDMYVVVGYGKQDAVGYSIQVKELYETQNSIYLDTVLIGPEHSETLNEKVSYPYIILKMEAFDDKLIDFH